MNRPLLLCAVLMVAPTAPASAQAVRAAPAHSEASLLAAEDARFAAQVARDVATINAGLGAELIYSHGNGRQQDRAGYLAGLAGGAIDYRGILPAERTVHVYGQAGTTRAVLTMQVGDRQMRSSVLGVYVWRDGRWQLVSWQTTPLPDPTPAAPEAGK